MENMNKRISISLDKWLAGVFKAGTCGIRLVYSQLNKQWLRIWYALCLCTLHVYTHKFAV